MASQGFDVSGTILAFLSDTARSSLELPHMTTGQRKQTKKLVEQYPELTCESFGFGNERQLHLFKKQGHAHIAAAVVASGELSCEVVPEPTIRRPRQTSGAIGGAVSVKNTFIDDFVENDFDDAARELRAVSTMPPSLSRILLDLTSSVDGKRENELASTASHSTVASPTPTPPPRSPTHELTSRMQVPPGFAPPPGLEVRNTFIHYGQPADDRIVQSMPHGMFGQCLLADLLRDAALKTQDTIKVPAPAPHTTQGRQFSILPLTSAEDGTLAPGTEVVITGLSKLPTFNGLKGTIQSLDEATARFSVFLIEPAGGHKWVKVKRENLIPFVSLPPPLSPSAYLPEVPATPTWDERPVAHPLSLTALV